MKRQILLYTFFIACLMPLWVNAKTYPVSAWGVVPNTPTNLSPLIQQALNDIKASAKKGEHIVLEFARGSLFSTPRRTVVEHNLFDHTSGTAILLCGDCNGWYETGACRNVIIRKNKFINALTNMFQFTNAVISIYPEIPDLKNQTGYFHGGRKGAIRITDNEFDTFDVPILYAKSVNGLVFRNNTIRTNTDYKPFHWNRQRFLLERVINADIEE